MADETKKYWNKPVSTVLLAEIKPQVFRNKNTSEEGCPDQLWSRVNLTGLLRLRSFLTENYPACNAPTFSGRKNDSFPTQLLLSLHWLLWNVSLQMLPSAGPSFSSIELQTLVDANEVEEPLCWELWKWRHKWKQMIFKKHKYPQHIPAGHMSWRGFSVPYVKHLFTLVDGYVDAWEESKFCPWNYTFGNLTLLERSFKCSNVHARILWSMLQQFLPIPHTFWQGKPRSHMPSAGQRPCSQRPY